MQVKVNSSFLTCALLSSLAVALAVLGGGLSGSLGIGLGDDKVFLIGGETDIGMGSSLLPFKLTSE